MEMLLLLLLLFDKPLAYIINSSLVQSQGKTVQYLASPENSTKSTLIWDYMTCDNNRTVCEMFIPSETASSELLRLNKQ